MLKKYFDDIRDTIVRYFSLLTEKNRYDMINIILINNNKLSIDSISLSLYIL
jgi:hypothetical protein